MPKQTCHRTVANSSSEPPQPTMTNGDVALRINSDLGQAFIEFVARVAQVTRNCTETASDPSDACIEDVAPLVYPQLQPGGLFTPLLKLAILMPPQKEIKPIVPCVQNTITSAARSNLGVSSVMVLCWMLFETLSSNNPSPSKWDVPGALIFEGSTATIQTSSTSASVNKTRTATTKTSSGSDLADETSSTATQSSSALPCPTGMFKLDCEHCNGNTVTEKCGDLKNGKWKNCPCNRPSCPASRPYLSKAALQKDLDTILSSMPAQYNPDAPISIGNQTALGVYRVQFKVQTGASNEFT